MDLKDKTKLVKVLGSASAALTKLEESVHAFEAQGKSPPKADVQLLKSIQRALDLLKINSFAGDVVPHNLWPAEFEHLHNLFRMELSQYWRLLYYVTGGEVTIISVVFEIIDHGKYNKLFGYKKK